VRVGPDVVPRDLILDGLEGLRMNGRPCPRHAGIQESIKGFEYGCFVFEKAIVEADETQKALELAFVRWSGSFLDGVDTSRYGTTTRPVQAESQDLNAVCFPNALLRVDLETRVS